METFALLLIMVAVLAFVVVPYTRNSPDEVKKNGAKSARLADLLAQRDVVLSAIKDLEFDHEMGKISDEDYEQMNTQYRQEAVAVLQAIDHSNGRRPARKALEAELRLLRQEKKTPGASFCRACGAATGAQDRFCSNCGHKLS